MRDETTLPIVTDAGRHRGGVSTVAQLADIPEEEIWLQKQKSARTRRAYRLDVQHFMKTLDITTAAELRQADHKAVIAWEGQQSTNCGASSRRSASRGSICGPTQSANRGHALFGAFGRSDGR